MPRKKSTPATRRIPVDDARGLVERALGAAGMPLRKAEAVADVLVEAELAGRSTHGLMRVPGMCRGSHLPSHEPKIIRETGPHALIDARGETGYITATMAVDMACERARGSGVSLVGVRNTGHAGYMGYYVRRGAARGMIAAVCADTFPRIAPTGSAEALMGSNPLAVAFPAEPHPIVIDMSTASVTNGALMLMQQLGMALPAGLARDALGEATTDPAEALSGSVVPFGGPKGYCLALMVQILSSAFLGSELIPERGGSYGILAAAVDPGLFTSRGAFATEMSSLRERIKALRAEEPEGEVLLPGERAARERETRLSDGIELSEELAAEIESLAGG